MELATLKARFPGCVTLALTATAPPTAISNPNRPNVFLKKIKRSGSNQGLKSYDEILIPIAEKLFYIYASEVSYDHYIHETKILWICVSAF